MNTFYTYRKNRRDKYKKIINSNEGGLKFNEYKSTFAVTKCIEILQSLQKTFTCTCK